MAYQVASVAAEGSPVITCVGAPRCSHRSHTPPFCSANRSIDCAMSPATSGRSRASSWICARYWSHPEYVP